MDFFLIRNKLLCFCRYHSSPPDTPLEPLESLRGNDLLSLLELLLDCIMESPPVSKHISEIMKVSTVSDDHVVNATHICVRQAVEKEEKRRSQLANMVSKTREEEDRILLTEELQEAHSNVIRLQNKINALRVIPMERDMYGYRYWYFTYNGYDPSLLVEDLKGTWKLIVSLDDIERWLKALPPVVTAQVVDVLLSALDGYKKAGKRAGCQGKESPPRRRRSTRLLNDSIHDKWRAYTSEYDPSDLVKLLEEIVDADELDVTIDSVPDIIMSFATN